LLNALWGDDDTLIVISTDLSHYLPYAEARALDAATARQILAGDGEFEGDQACGVHGVRGFMVAAQEHRLAPRLLDLRSSGDTAGDRSRVVGYASFAYTRGGRVMDTGTVLIKLARDAITAALGGPAVIKPALGRLDEPGACFVSLKQGEALRGCIGNLRTSPTLYDAVVHNAEAAALHDPRFSPLRRDELARTRIEISLMSPLSNPGAHAGRADRAPAARRRRAGALRWAAQRGVHPGDVGADPRRRTSSSITC
jgi:hypothetical protein